MHHGVIAVVARGSSMMVPTVSVVMTVYNAARYLATAVESVLSQTYSDFECVIIDDGSRDGSLAILKRYAERDSRIRLVSRCNTGISRARNEGLSLARGEFVAVMDADDIALPTRLATQIDYLQTHPGVACVGGWFEVIDSAGRLLTRLEPPTGNEEIQALLLKGHTSICQPSSMLRRDAVEKVGGFEEDLAPSEDLDLYLKLGEVGTLANIPQTLVRYRIHGKSASASARVRQFESSQAACEQAWKRRGVNGHFEPSDPWRPDRSRTSRYEWLLKCGWWAFQSREHRTALVYGLKAIGTIPYRSGGWRLVACCAVKRDGR